MTEGPPFGSSSLESLQMIEHTWARKLTCEDCGGEMPKDAAEADPPIAVYWLCRPCDIRIGKVVE